MKLILTGILFIFSLVCFSQEKKIDIDFPSPREQASLIYHPQSKALLLIGGFPVVPESFKSDVWKWDGNLWVKIQAGGPRSRYFFQGAINNKTGFIYHFGGTGIGEFKDIKDDMWAFNGNIWIQAAFNNIGKRHHHKLVYADHLDAFVLYGGFNEANVADTTTWIFRNGEFYPLSIAGPGIRYQSAMVYDKQRKKVVLYGGGDQPNELWEFDGIKWEKKVSSINPGPKFHHQLVYDDHQKAVILHGGQINL